MDGDPERLEIAPPVDVTSPIAATLDRPKSGDQTHKARMVTPVPGVTRLAKKTTCPDSLTGAGVIPFNDIPDRVLPLVPGTTSPLPAIRVKPPAKAPTKRAVVPGAEPPMI